MMFLLLSACLSSEDGDEDWGDAPPSDEPVADATIPTEPDSLPPAPDGMIHLCVNGAPGFQPPAASWMFASNDGHIGQVELEAPWQQRSRCGLIQGMFARSGLTLRSESAFPPGEIGGMSYQFDNGSLHGVDYINTNAGGTGFFEMTFLPVVPPGE